MLFRRVSRPPSLPHSISFFCIYISFNLIYCISGFIVILGIWKMAEAALLNLEVCFSSSLQCPVYTSFSDASSPFTSSSLLVSFLPLLVPSFPFSSPSLPFSFFLPFSSFPPSFSLRLSIFPQDTLTPSPPFPRSFSPLSALIVHLLLVSLLSFICLIEINYAHKLTHTY